MNYASLTCSDSIFFGRKPNLRSVQCVLQAEELSPGFSKTVRLCIAKVTQETYFKNILFLSDNP